MRLNTRAARLIRAARVSKRMVLQISAYGRGSDQPENSNVDGALVLTRLSKNILHSFLGARLQCWINMTGLFLMS